MGLRELKSELKKQDKETLIKHVSEFYKKYKPVKEYFDFYINPNENELIEKHKEKEAANSRMNNGRKKPLIHE